MKKQITKRFLTLSILVIATIFSLSFQPQAAELLKNGGCEEGLPGTAVPFWTQTNTSNPTVFFANVVQVGQPILANVPYLSPSHAQEGNRSCYMWLASLTVNVNTVRFYQDITVPANTTLTVSWKQHLSQQNVGNVTTENIRLRVLIRNTSDTILQTVYARDLIAQTNEILPWENLSFNLGTTYAGQTIRLEFNANITDDNPPNYSVTKGLWEIDAVSANALAPTAAAVSVSGRVLNADGRPISGAIVRIMDINGSVQSTRTNQFGQYRFSVEAGNVYAIETQAKGLRFIDNPRIITVQDEVAEEDFRADSVSFQKQE